jgi:hypothetical protein
VPQFRTVIDGLAKLAGCPEGDMLVVHSPPKGHMDGRDLGSEAALTATEGEAAAARRLRADP